MNTQGKVGAIVLAAGMSRRMGVPKMTLAWQGTTVLGAVLNTLSKAGVTNIRVVLGANRDEVERVVDDVGGGLNVERVYNSNYANGEMLDSIRVGLEGLDPAIDAVLIVLGDQPQLETEVVTALVERYFATGGSLLVPSYQMRRGHPWLVARALWDDLIGMAPGETMRDFLNRHSKVIEYLEVNSPSVLADLDTPEDYKKALEKS